MAAETNTKTVEMRGSDIEAQTSLSDGTTSTPTHTSNDEDNWSILSSTSSRKVFVTGNQRLLSSSETSNTEAESEDESDCESDDESICESIYSSDNESTCTEEQELDHARRCENLESKLNDLQSEIEKCWCERAELYEDRETLLEEKNELAKEKHVLLKGTNVLLKEKKVLVTEKVNLLETVEALTLEKKRDLGKYNLEFVLFVKECNAQIDGMQHAIEEKEALLVEKQKLLEAAQALTEKNRLDAKKTAMNIVCLMDKHEAELTKVQQTMGDKNICLGVQQTMLKAAEALAEAKSQEAHNSDIEVQRLRDQEVATFELMQKTIEVLKNEHAQELKQAHNDFRNLENEQQQKMQMCEHDSDELYKWHKESEVAAEKKFVESIANSDKVIEDLQNTVELRVAENKILQQKCDEVQNELALAQKERDALHDDLFDVKADRDEVEAERDAFDLELDDMADLICEKEEVDEQLLVAHEELAKANIECLKVKEELDTANIENLKLKEELQSETHGHYEHLVAVRGGLTIQLRDAEAERDGLISKVRAVKDLIQGHMGMDLEQTTTRQELATTKSNRLKLEKDLEDQKKDHRQHLDQMTAYQHELKGDLYEAASERDAFSSQLDTIRCIRNDLEEELEKVKRHGDDLEKKFQDMVVLQKEHLDEMRVDLVEAKVSRDAYQEQLRQVSADGTALKEELKDVKEELEQVKGDRNSVQGELNDLMIMNDIVEEKLEEVMVAGNSLEDELNEYIKGEKTKLTEAKKKLQVFECIFPVVEKYSGDEFQQSLMNLRDKHTRTTDTEVLKAWLSSMMAEVEVEVEL